MYTFKVIIFLLAFILAITSARPVALRRRRTCHPPAVSSLPTGTASATESGEVNQPLPSSGADAGTPPKSSSSSSSTSSNTSNDDDDKDEDTTTSHSSTGNNLLAALFPASSSSNKKWTTSSSSSSALPLSDSTFRPEKILSSLTHKYVQHAGKSSMQAHYPKGSYTFGHDPQGGISFYAPGPASVDLSTAKEATFGYSVYFPAGFQFNMGGKLPGLYGGDSDDDAVSCSGGRRSHKCFSARLMWRDAGKGELYTYLPMDGDFAVNNKQCKVAPYSECNPTYGASVGRGSFKFATGQWTTVSERVRLNDAGKNNGELELFVNGKSVVNVSGLKLREGSEGKIRGIQMQTFFGGHDSEWASPKDQDVFFADFSTAITEFL